MIGAVELPDVRDTLEFGEHKNHYDKSFYCANCGNHFRKWIKRGVRVDTVTIKCPKCDCTV